MLWASRTGPHAADVGKRRNSTAYSINAQLWLGAGGRSAALPDWSERYWHGFSHSRSDRGHGAFEVICRAYNAPGSGLGAWNNYIPPTP